MLFCLFNHQSLNVKPEDLTRSMKPLVAEIKDWKPRKYDFPAFNKLRANMLLALNLFKAGKSKKNV
jgi:hypothetical protein